MTKKAVLIYSTVIAVLLTLVISWYISAFMTGESDPVPTGIPATLTISPTPLAYDGTRALSDVLTQAAFGPRTPGSEGHTRIRAWLQSELESAGWIVQVQQTERMGHPIFNISARRNADPPQIILGAHYDTRFFADNDPDPAKRGEPVIGANDGASGVAVLLELARSLPKDTVPVWLVFFDTEDQGRIAGWDWILGSRAFAGEIKIAPRAVVIVDMIGDADLNIHLEKNSNTAIRAAIWSTAEELGYGNVFINQEKYSMEDDHTPFLEAGIPAVDIIDFDYPYWHTTQDTPDKVSAQSLQAVGETLRHWILDQTR